MVIKNFIDLALDFRSEFLEDIEGSKGIFKLFWISCPNDGGGHVLEFHIPSNSEMNQLALKLFLSKLP